MTTIKRRQFVTRVGLGSAALVSAAAGAGSSAFGQGAHNHERIDGPLASATVSFGEWPVGAQPLDRMALPTAPQAPNAHLLIPNTVKIKAGGSVNYVIAGFHQIGIYAPGTEPTDINPTRMPGTPVPNAPPPVFLIDDPVNRVYRGLNPITLPQDRVEVVQFANPGVYFVTCLVSVHFADGMFGWVRVLP